jgi:hypothetical protein
LSSEDFQLAWIITKYAITALLVVLISEVAKRSDKLGALIAALPMVTVLAMIWLYLEGQPAEKISNHALYTFWYVLPTLPMFLVFRSFCLVSAPGVLLRQVPLSLWCVLAFSLR